MRTVPTCRRILLGLMALLLAAAVLPAQGAPKPNPGETREKAIIREVTADPVFGGEKEETRWRYMNASAGDSAEQGVPATWFEYLQDMLELVGKMLRVLVWVAMVALVAGLVYLTWRYRHAWLGSMRMRAAPPEFLFGLDVRPESLPDDVVSAALQELARGNATAALSLLYRAALVSLIHQRQLDFHAGHTEDDCLRLAQAAVDAGCSRYFAQLLEAWKLAAYAHAAPPPSGIEALCHGWRGHFTQVDCRK